MSENVKTVGLHFNDGHYIAIGKLVVAFQMIESIISFNLAKLANPDIFSSEWAFYNLLINELSFSNRLKLLSNFIETHDNDFFVHPGSKFYDVRLGEYLDAKNNLTTLFSKCSELEQKRNQIIHSNWITSPAAGPDGTVIRMKITSQKKKTSGCFEFTTAEDINNIVSEMENLITVLGANVEVIYQVLISNK